jgi:hypothetical protein
MKTNDQHMTCDGFTAKLAEYLDGDLPETGRAAMNEHAASCAECGALLSELDSLRVEAAALPLLEPSRDLWAGIAERIDARVLPLDAPRTARVAAMRRTWRHPAVAAAALVLVTAGVTHVWTRNSLETQASSTVAQITANPVVVEPARASGESPAERMNTIRDRMAAATQAATAGSGAEPDRTTPRADVVRSASQPVASLASTSPSTSPTARRIMSTEVEPVYDREIVKLRAIMRDRRAQLDPQTVAVLEQSIAVIDSAIAQSRAALAKDPASGFLATQLNHSLEKKVELLRTAALLPART